ASGDLPRRKLARPDGPPLDDAPAPAGDGEICPQHDQGADDGRDPSARGEAPGAVGPRATAEQRLADHAADERSHHPEDGGHEPAHRLTAGKDGTSDEADDETENQEADDSHWEDSSLKRVWKRWSDGNHAARFRACALALRAAASAGGARTTCGPAGSAAA